MIKLEVGKFYANRLGQKIGPIKHMGLFEAWPYSAAGSGSTYAPDGTTCISNSKSPHDLVAEWKENVEMSKFVEKVTKIKSVYNATLTESDALMSVSKFNESDITVVIGASFHNSYRSRFNKKGLAELIGHLQEVHDAL